MNAKNFSKNLRFAQNPSEGHKWHQGCTLDIPALCRFVTVRQAFVMHRHCHCILRLKLVEATGN